MITAKFITFEGCEASGKSTQALILRDYLLGKGYKVFLTKEPGGTILANKLRDIILHNEIIDVLTEFLLLSAARRDHILEIKHKLNEGYFVISDRFYDSSIAIQSVAKGLDLQLVNYITENILEGIHPNITFLLDINIETLYRRLQNSDRLINFYDQKDRHFHKRVKEGFLQIAKQDRSDRIVTIDAANDIEIISEEIKNYIANLK